MEAAEGEGPPGAAWAWSRLDLPPVGPAYLRTHSQEIAILTREAGQWSDDTVVVESLFLDGGRSPRLLILVPPGQRLSINGEPASRVAIAAMRDVLAFGNAHPMFVSLFEQPVMGLAGKALAGATCPVCKTVTSAGQEVWQCAVCSAVVHNAKPDSADAERDGYACLTLSGVCPVCKQPIRTNAGLIWIPSEKE
ncbi:MAG TPA: hypothetical protein PKY77_02670 [Phycisphaerae bacterium]|nr:hypothetical protein [Phycisphaerae bacterium]HRY66648.1 hypothetical protein [Phycisphaerae bacterium]HSA27649.1 hypothetical protein [Phycisphaerae bacterium]